MGSQSPPGEAISASPRIRPSPGKRTPFSPRHRPSTAPKGFTGWALLGFSDVFRHPGSFRQDRGRPGPVHLSSEALFLGQSLGVVPIR